MEGFDLRLSPNQRFKIDFVRVLNRVRLPGSALSRCHISSEARRGRSSTCSKGILGPKAAES